MEINPISNKRTTHQWFLSRNIIDFDPSYQRKGNLWPLRNQALLINSILNGYDIPKIYFADFSYGSTRLKEKSKLYAIIDGKQRLTTIFKFFNDELELDSTPVKYKEREIKLTGLRYSTLKDLHPELASKIEEFDLTIMSVISNDEREINELFVRLNLNVTISGPEIRNAMPGPIPQLIRNLAIHSIFTNNINFKTDRGQEFNVLAKLILLESGEDYLTLGKARLDKFVRDKSELSYEDFSNIEENIILTLNTIQKVFSRVSEKKGKGDKLLASQNLFFIYYTFIRNHLEDDADRIRSFLENFDKKRQKVAKMIRSGELDLENQEPNLAPYITYATVFRSPDNKASIELMLQILEREYVGF